MILEERLDSIGRTLGTFGVSQSSGWSAIRLPEIVDPLRSRETVYENLQCYEHGSFCLAFGFYYDHDEHGSSSEVPVIAVEEDEAWSVVRAPEPDAAWNWTYGDCTGRTFCVWPAGSIAAIFSDGTWSADSLPAGSGVTDISCASLGSCTAVGSDSEFAYGGAMLQYSQGAWSVEPAPATEEAAARAYSLPTQISCSSAVDCTAIGLSEGAFDYYWGEVFTETGGHWSAENVPLPQGAVFGAAHSMSCYGPEECTFLVGASFDGENHLRAYIIDQSPGGLSSPEAAVLPPDAPSEVFDIGALSCASSSSCHGLVRYTAAADESENRVALLTINHGPPRVVRAPMIAGEELSIANGDVYSAGAMSCPDAQVCGLIGDLGSKAVVVMLEE
jgi:hypothetical protein